MAIKAAGFDIAGPLTAHHPIIGLTAFLHGKKLFNPAAYQEFERIIVEYKAERMPYNIAAAKAVAVFGEGIKGQSKARIDSAARAFVRGTKGDLLPHFVKLLKGLQTISPATLEPANRNGERIQVGLISTEPLAFVQSLGKELGIKPAYCFGTEFELSGGRYTGKLVSNGIEQRKEGGLTRFMKAAGVKPTETVFFGDRLIDRIAAQKTGAHFIAANARNEVLEEMRKTPRLQRSTTRRPAIKRFETKVRK